jgi:beta-glucan synthesis-associated protein KRE6
MDTSHGPPPPTAKRGRAVKQASAMTQAGRSESHLNAERNSAEIRISRAFPPALRSQVTARSLRDVSSSQAASKLAVGKPLSSSESSAGKRVPYTSKKLSSLINPSTSSISSRSSEDNASPGDSAVSDDNRFSSSAEKSLESGIGVMKRGSRLGSGLTPVQQLLHQKLVSTPRLETPKFVGDLGRDYSRYPMSDSNSRGHLISVPLARASPSARLFVSRTQLPSFGPTNPYSNPTITTDYEEWGYPNDNGFNPHFGGEKDFILYPDEVEEGDDNHVPRDDDDTKFRPKWGDHFNRRAIISTIGVIFITLGLLCFFIALPIIFFTGSLKMALPGVDYNWWTPKPNFHPPRTWAIVNDRNYSLLTNVRGGLIDPDTPKSAMTRKSTFDGADLCNFDLIGFKIMVFNLDRGC